MPDMTNPELLKTPLAKNGDKNTLPLTTGATTGLFSQDLGFQEINSTPLTAGGKAPDRKDMNAAFNLLGGVAFMAQKGWTFHYDASQDYYLGCVVIDPADGNRYECIADMTAGTIAPHEDTDETYWQMFTLGDGVPIGTILPWSSNSATLPGGYLECKGQAVSRTMYPDLFAAIGTQYGAGDGSTTFNLPNPLDCFLQGSLTAGTSIAAGLPNITGGIYSKVWSMGTTVASRTEGAITQDVDLSRTISNVTDGTYGVAKVTFDASQSSAIYGNSTTVQPPALTVRYLIKAFDGQTADSALIDITQYAQRLEEKVDKVTFNDLFRSTAAAHNCLYRGKDLTAYFESGEMSTAISNGSFDDIYPGDYIVKTVTVNGVTYDDVKFIVMDLDYFQPWRFEDTETHHLVMMPETALGTQYMNSTNITTGGYVGSYMHVTHIPKVNTGIVAAFGSAHVLEHQDYLTNTVDTSKPSGAGSGYTGCATGWVATTGLKCCLCSENMVYGGRVWGSAMDTGCANKQLSAFRHNSQLRKTTSFWLRAVSRSTYFANANSNGVANSDSASNANGVRPYFLLA